MLLTVDDLITLVRSSVNVQDPSGSGEIDPAYLSMTDEDIKLFVKLGVSRAFPDVEDLSDLPSGSEYAVVLLAKIELYLKLAVLRSNDVDLGADGAYIKKDQRFTHYMTLLEGARKDYDDWLANESTGVDGGGGGVVSANILLSNRHYSTRNYEFQKAPKVHLVVDNVTADKIDFHWSVTNISHFGRFKVYFSTSPIVNMYKEGAEYKDKISEGAQLVMSTSDPRNTYKEVSDLLPRTTYYIAVFSIERNQVFGYKEIEVETLGLLEDEEEIL